MLEKYVKIQMIKYKKLTKNDSEQNTFAIF